MMSFGRYSLFAAALVACSSVVANAADVVDTCDTSWSGLYVGAHAGYVTGKGDYGPDTVNIDGFMGGGLAGYNYQTCNLVLGLEGDFGIGEVDGNNFGAGINDWDLEPNGHIRARLGLPMDSFMPFVAAGLALGDIDVNTGPGPNDGGMHYGFTGGAGLDMKLNENIIVRGEYLFDAYGSKSNPGGDTSANTHTLRAALIWQFN